MGRKKSAAINDLISAGLVGEGELLRYKNKAGQLLLIGRARFGGVEVKGSADLLNFTAFEAASGAKYHRPAEHTHAISGRTLQALQLGAAAAADGAGGGSTAADRAASEAAGEPLVEEEHDEFCYVCGLGGDLMCCETCSTTMHAPCAGLETVPEGDWYCPWCHCAACGQPGQWGEQAEGEQAEAAPAPPLLHCGVAWVECGEGYRSLGARAAGVHGEQPLRPPYVGPPEEEGEDAGARGAAAFAADGAVRMEIDGVAADTVAAGAAEQPGAAGGGSSELEAARQPVAAEPRPGSGRLDLSQLLAVLAEAAAAAPPAATLLGGAAAGEGAAAQSAAAGAAAREAAVEARCPVTGQRHHACCLPPGFHAGQEQEQQGEQEGDGGGRGSSQPPLWFSSKGAELLSWRLAQLCSRGLIPVGALGDGTPVSFQLVRGAAVAQPQDCCGYAPGYSQAQREELRRALSAAAVLLQSCYEPLVDSRTGGNAMLWMLRGACMAGRQLDLSAMHTALLYVGSSLAAAACVRVLGPSVAEVPLLATRPELQRNKLGAALLAALEAVVAAVCSGAGGSGGSGSGNAPLLLTPAFWGPGSAYVAYPPGQPGVPDVVPVMQAKWGYALASRQQLLEAWRHPLLRLPGLLLACKQLGGQAVAPVQLALPRRLALNEAGSDVGRMLKEGTAVLAPKEEPAQPVVKGDPMIKEEREIGVKYEHGSGAGF